MKRTADKEIYGVRSTGSADKLILLFAFVAGVAGSIALKTIEVHSFVPAAFTALVIIFYAVLTYFTSSLRLEPESIGDNCYYLGFVFTLSSLAVTLYELSDAHQETQFVSNVISGFGVALSSTIVGISIRVFLLQFRPNLVAREREMRVELNDSMRDFRTALTQSVSSLRLFSVEIQQSLKEHNEKTAKMTEKYQTEQNSQTARHFEAMIGQIASEHQRVTATLEEGFSASLKAVVNSSESAINSNVAMIKSAVNESGKSLDKFAVTLENLTVSLSKQEQTVRSIVDSTTQELGSSIQELSGTLVLYKEKAEGAGSNILNETNNLIDRIEKTDLSINESAENLVNRIEEITTETNSAVLRLKEAVKNVELENSPAVKRGSLIKRIFPFGQR
jgi:hypothetical protein